MTRGADGLFESLDEGDGEDERRFSDGFGAMDGFGGRILEKRDAEMLGIGHGADRRDFVRRGAVRLERAVAAPHELLAAEPAVALREGALDLSAVDAGDDGVADVVDGLDVDEFVFAGQGADLDFEDAA